MAEGSAQPPRGGRLFVITAPSGAGKTTVLKGLMDRTRGIVFSVSYTTRAKRPGEEEGRDYIFVSQERFEEMIQRGELAEWTETYGHFYGTGKIDLENLLATGMDVILDLDVRGYLAVKESFPDAVGVFISPPSLEVLEERLKERGTEGPGELRLRLDSARKVMGRAEEFERVVVNDTVAAAVEELVGIVEHARETG